MSETNVSEVTYSGEKSAACEICFSLNTHRSEIRPDLSYFICRNCNHASRMISKLQIKDLFKSSQEKYFGENSTINLVAEGFLEKEGTTQRQVIVQKFVNKSLKVLEVGPGAGSFLRWMCSKGHHVTAIEDSTFLAKELSSVSGSEIIVGEFEHCNLPENSFDLFCSFHVIEHVLDPRAHLELAIKYVKPGGLAFIATPNANSWEQRLFPRLSPNFDSAHLRVFSQKSLRILAQDVGWSVVYEKTPEYSSSWLRVFSKILRKFRGEDEEATAGKYLLNQSFSRKMLLYFIMLFSYPFRILQSLFNGGNEIFTVLKRESDKRTYLN
jgi:2-polyprenyl-3-methyl-5-hydroxy-6-metoxy-1,4-benzoquinol methylase